MEERKDVELYLFTTFYQDKNDERHQEYLFTIGKNIENPSVKKIIFLLDTDVEIPFESDKIITTKVKARPTYGEFLSAIHEYGSETAYNAIAATDIYFNSTIQLLNTIDFRDTALTLNRWDLLDKTKCEFFNRYYTSDTWIFKGIPKKLEADYYLGQAGCDNRFIYDLHSNGYRVLNPSLSIVTLHLHASQIRTWGNPGNYNPVPKPYLFTLPDFIETPYEDKMRDLKKVLHRQIRYDLNKVILRNQLEQDVHVLNKPSRLGAFFNCIRYFNYTRKFLKPIEFKISDLEISIP